MLDVLSDVPTPRGVVNEERDPKRMRLELTFSDFKIPPFGLIDPDIQSHLKEVLPCMAKAYKKKNWFLLQDYTSSSTGGFSLDIEHAVKSEFAAICVWLLLCGFPPDVKEDAARVLTSISFGTSEAPNVFDKESIETLVSRVLCHGGTMEVKRQVCFAISFLARCSNDRLTLQFGAGIQDGLLQLVRDPRCSSELTFPLISAIANIAIASKAMREKILETEIDDSWLGKLMDKTLDRSILEQACYAVACMATVACGKDSGKLWDHFKFTFIPAIIDKCSVSWHRSMLGPAASAISRITKYAASSPDHMEKIKYLVGAGVLWALFDMNRVCGDEILWASLIGIEIILEAGDVVEGRRKPKPKPKPRPRNKYAKMIDDFEEGWEILIPDEEYYNYETIVKAKKLLKTYRPELLYNTKWKRFEGQSDMEAWEEDNDISDDDESDDDETDDEMQEDEDEDEDDKEA